MKNGSGDVGRFCQVVLDSKFLVQVIFEDRVSVAEQQRGKIVELIHG